MKLYEIDIAGLKHTVQLSEEDAAKYPDAVAKGDAKQTLIDSRAPSAKGLAADEAGNPLVESAAKENAARRAKQTGTTPAKNPS